MLHSAQSSEYVLYVNGADTKSQKKGLRASIVGAALMIAMVGAVALVASSHGPSASVELAQVVSRSESELATNILKAGKSASLAEIHNHIKGYSQMLASAPMLAEGDGGASKLCPKADVVISKLDTLYNKLQNGAAEETDDRSAAKKTMEDDHQAYLDCESAADLAKKEKDEAKKGADFATDQYNNYKETVESAENNIVSLRGETADKLKALKAENDMIEKILRMLGMLEEVGPSAKGVEAGGKVVEPAQAQAINKQIANLKQAASKMGGVQMQQAARLSNLMSYQETDEVKAILMQMLTDIQNQVDTTNAMLSEAESDLVTQQTTLNGYQTTMVDLNTKHDEAAGDLIAANQKRPGCFSKKEISEENYVDLLARDTMTQPSTLKEMAIIIRIELKLQDYCGSYFAENGISTGNDNAYFKDNGIDLQNPDDGRYCVTGYFGFPQSVASNWPSINDRAPDFAVLADDLDFTGRNTPRKVFSQGFMETLRIGDKKDDANLAAFDGTQSLLETGARTQSLGFGFLKNLANKAKNVVNHVVDVVKDVHGDIKDKIVDKFDDIKDKIANVVAVPRVNEPVANINTSPDVASSNFYMEGNGVIEVSETTNYKFCVESDDLGAVYVDGKQVGSVASAGNKQCGTAMLEAGFRYLQVRYTEQGGADMIQVKAAKCKTDDANDCGPMKQIRPKMSWPPVCGDSVKYSTAIGAEGAQAAADA